MTTARSTTRQPAAARRRAREREILAATRRLFDESGVRDAQIEDVARAVGVNRAIISRALTGGRTFLGNLEQSPACVNIVDVGDEWIVRAVNVTPYDLAHLEGRSTTMEELWQQFRST